MNHSLRCVVIFQFNVHDELFLFSHGGSLRVGHEQPRSRPICPTAPFHSSMSLKKVNTETAYSERLSHYAEFTAEPWHRHPKRERRCHGLERSLKSTPVCCARCRSHSRVKTFLALSKSETNTILTLIKIKMMLMIKVRGRNYI